MDHRSTLPHFLEDLPPGLQPLVGLAMDLRWTWSHAGDSLWKMIDEETWAQTENPFVILQSLNRQRLEELAANTRFKEQLQALASAREEYYSQPGWYGDAYDGTGPKGIAYFSMEFGLGEALPLYAGGLGVLAGDYLKAGSDLGVPLVGIGLLYQEGYFRQVLDDSGWQQEVYSYNDSVSLPLQPTLSRSGAWLHVPIELPGRSVQLRVWQAQVGRVTLYLLDSNGPLNSPINQGLTRKLYGGGHELRLIQEIALGVGGWRVIEALGLEIDVCHLNEGHAAFVTLERARCFMESSGVDFWEALWATRGGNVFTTHTPVAAGFDTFERNLMARYGREYAISLGVEPASLMALGRINSHDGEEPFNMAYLAARTCARINGVSRLHGEVSRRIFQDLYPRWPRSEVPIGHVTNGVHVPSWDSPWADEIWTQACGKGRWLGTDEVLMESVEDISDETLWTLCGQGRADLVRHARARLTRQCGERGNVESAAAVQAEHILDPNILTLGFARRFTEYKRPNLLLSDPERLARLLKNVARPVQIIVAGKAHPEDRPGKLLLQQWAQFVQRPDVRAHAVFLEDYDIALAQELVQGVDVWINTPRRPWEASGTSGMKVLVNGGLNLSELDGWWAEAWSDDVGWALGDGREHAEPGWDALEAEQLYRLLEEQVVPLFYTRDVAGIPRGWVTRMRASMSRLAPRFSTNRMVREYVENLYRPASTDTSLRTADGGRLARELRAWEQMLERHWAEVRIGDVDIREAPEGWTFSVQVYLGGVRPEWVAVQVYANPVDEQGHLCQILQQGPPIAGALNGYLYQGSVATDRPAGDFTPRVVAHRPEVRAPSESTLIRWP